MNLYLRLLRVVLAALLRRRPLAVEEVSVLRFRTGLLDLDPNRHMNNGRFLTLMDLGRVDLMVRMGLAGEAVRRRWMPVIASAMVRWRRSLLPFQAFELHTRLIGWDEKWFFIEQRFVRDGRTVAVGLVKGLFRRPGGHVPTAEVLQASLGEQPMCEQLPQSVHEWMAAERHLSGFD